MIHLKPTCDKRRTKKDGTSPIVFRITLSGKSRDVASGFSCKPNQWDASKNTVKPKTPELNNVAQRLRDKELLLLEKIREYEQKFPNSIDVQMVKNYLTKKEEKPTSVLQLWEDEILRMRKANRFGMRLITKMH